MESIKAVILPAITTTASHILRHRWADGDAWIAPRQRVLPDPIATEGRILRPRAACRAAAHGGHRGSEYGLSSLRQRAVH